MAVRVKKTFVAVSYRVKGKPDDIDSFDEGVVESAIEDAIRDAVIGESTDDLEIDEDNIEIDFRPYTYKLTAKDAEPTRGPVTVADVREFLDRNFPED